jgi:hypothetical protein
VRARRRGARGGSGLPARWAGRDRGAHHSGTFSAPALVSRSGMSTPATPSMAQRQCCSSACTYLASASAQARQSAPRRERGLRRSARPGPHHFSCSLSSPRYSGSKPKSPGRLHGAQRGGARASAGVPARRLKGEVLRTSARVAPLRRCAHAPAVQVRGRVAARRPGGAARGGGGAHHRLRAGETSQDTESKVTGCAAHAPACASARGRAAPSRRSWTQPGCQ